MDIPTYYFHYDLIDPRDHSVFYIGCTTNPNRRYRRHIRCIENNQAKNDRIQEILSAGYFPFMNIKDVSVSKETAYAYEQHRIQSAAQHNPRLTNIMGTKIVDDDENEDDE